MANTATAIVHREVGGKSKLETIKLDALKPDEALVEIHAVGVCHTDLSCMDGMLPAQFPAVFGHEGAGVVLEVGSGVKDISKGDKVLCSYAHCGSCESCTSGLPAYCVSFIAMNFSGGRMDGSSTMTVEEKGENCHGNFFGQSSFANKSVVSRSSLVKVPADANLELLAPLGCGLQTGAGAVMNTLDVQAGSSVAVFGVGSVGLAALMAAKIRGAKTIIAVDLQPKRLELAKQLGATHTIVGSDEDVVQQIQKLCPPTGVKYGVECTGVPKVVETMLNALGTKGKGATVGAPPPGKTASVDIFTHLLLGRQYMGCTEGESVTHEFIPYLIEQHKKGAFPFDKFVTFYDAKDFQQAFADMHDGKTIKAVLKWT